MLKTRIACVLPLIGLLTVGVTLDAHAVAITLLGHSTQGVGNTADVYAGNYNGTTPVGATWSSNPIVVPPPGNWSGIYQSPFNNTPLLDTQSYFSVGGVDSAGDGAQSPVTLTYSSWQNTFSMLWGSIDSYNTLEFRSGSTVRFSLSGLTLGSALGGGAPPNYEQVALLSFSFGANELFNNVRFISTQAAFEFALPGAPRAVPEPGTLGLLAMGMGLLGFGLLRRRRA